MGGSLDMTSATSWREAFASRNALFRPGQGLPLVVRRTHGSDRDSQILAVRPSLPHVRHDHSPAWLCAFIITDALADVNLIWRGLVCTGVGPRLTGLRIWATAW